MKRNLVWGIIVMLSVLFLGCNNTIKTNVESSPELEHTQNVIEQLYGKGNTYSYLSYENDLAATVSDGDLLYRDLTFYEVYSNNKKICWFACNANTLKTLVKEVSDPKGYRQVRITEGMAYFDKYEIE